MATSGVKEFDFSYQLKMSARRKTLSITVYPDNRVVVHAPATCPRVKLARFIEEKSDWVRKALETNLKREPKAGEKSFQTGETIHYLGKEYRLRVEPGGPPGVTVDEGHICVRFCGEKGLDAPSMVKEQLTAWYVSRMLAKARERVTRYAARIGVSPGRVTIKSMQSRWGSCSTSGRISLAWNIIMAPEEVIDYLIVHELCHLVHHNHSEQYWALVGSILPDHRERRKWLRVNGGRLRL
ncbi:MAG: SprT family zinc-dependent metalloprotease [Syntrophobacteraceae bacterium]|nr:SprT family zinc-dependent metalloprotease [Syntrophobacteraceae bacterium]